jgi:hypothetical protein
MKNLFLALAVVGLSYSSSNAQAIGNSANSKNAKNYSVCLKGGQYTLCNPNITKQDVGRTSEADESSLAMMTTTVHMGNVSSGNARYRGRIRVTYDDPNAPYLGQESMVNDGVQKNKARNINTNNAAYDLPPNDGGRTNP